MFYFYANVLNFSPELLGLLSTINSICTVLGIIIYQLYFKNVTLIIKINNIDKFKKISDYYKFYNCDLRIKLTNTCYSFKFNFGNSKLNIYNI